MKSKNSVQKKRTPASVISSRMESIHFFALFRSLIIKIIVFAVFVIVALTAVFGISVQKGEGMYPRIRDGDLLIYFRVVQNVENGDILTLTKDGVRYTARVVAHSGDKVEMSSEGKLVVNGTAQYEETFYDTYSEGSPLKYPYEVPQGSYFILGDMRTGATDSRDFGAVSKSDLDGKVITIIRRRGL